MDEQQRSTPPEQINWRLLGDRERADSLRGVGLQFKEQAQRQNIYGYTVFVRRFSGRDGTTYAVMRNCGPLVDVWTIEIFSPLGKQLQPGQEPVNIPVLQPGQFYYVPGCKARYSFKNEDLQNEIYVDPETIDPGLDTTNTGQGVQTLTLKNAGLSQLRSSPDGSISRDANVCYLQGADPESSYSGGNLKMSSYNIPTDGAFSISAMVRLRSTIEYDYTFTSKTQELDCGYQVYNPIKPRVLISSDGVGWSAICPGSIAPLIGWHIPSRFSNHWCRFTYPWPVNNTDFVANGVNFIGYREIETVCSGEPLMESDYGSSSPYWDKVETGELESLSGEFIEFWEENTEINNTEPYASYCKFKIEGYHPLAGRVVGEFADGSHCYGFVYSRYSEYDDVGNITYTICTIRDHEYKKHIKDCLNTLIFGDQPFPVAHPQGYMIGTNFLGMMWYNGNRILAGKICDFETEFGLSPVVSDSLELNIWYHVCMTVDKYGNCTLYLTKKGRNNTVIYKSKQSANKFSAKDESGNVIKVSVGADKYAMTQPLSDPVVNVSEWEFSASMDTTMNRYYWKEISKGEAILLSLEGTGQAFIADDFEVAQLQGLGMQAVTI